MMSHSNAFLPLALEDWKETRETLHLFLQIVGKIRLSLFPKKNHWWHVPFYVSTQGLTTGPIPYRDNLLELEFNFRTHQLEIKSSHTQTLYIDLAQYSVPEFYDRVIASLDQIGIAVEIRAQPYDIPEVKATHFSDCHAYNSYEPAQATSMWHILVSVNNVFQEFRGRFTGKSTPVHLFWHHFDLALTRFSGHRAPQRTGISQVEREAYSHEVISFGFWFGDSRVPEPAFYAYGFPPPSDVYTAKLQPTTAQWDLDGGMALLKYADVRESAEPRDAILDFLESTYRVYADRMGWDIKEWQLEQK
jgi:hypothetical protein